MSLRPIPWLNLQRGKCVSSISVSIVIYHDELAELEPLLRLLANCEQIARWIVIDNGDSPEIQQAVRAIGGVYLRSGRNLGFGAGHNLALRELANVQAKYHLILNPDISFDADALSKLAEVMEDNPDVGLAMPRVLYPDGSNQFLCKLLPTPLDLILRRFAPGIVKQIARKRIARYELRNFDYRSPAYVPSLSGCFMFTRRSVLHAVGGFDERFFLYMEDVDLCRRIREQARLLYWPGVTVHHVHQMGSYRSLRVLLLHVRSAIAYFNKWGWVFDAKREEVNRAALANLPMPRS